jgi:hypothetical protein
MPSSISCPTSAKTLSVVSGDFLKAAGRTEQQVCKRASGGGLRDSGYLDAVDIAHAVVDVMALLGCVPLPLALVRDLRQ